MRHVISWFVLGTRLFGNAAQLATAAGAIIFGLASMKATEALFELQTQLRVDAALGRTTDRLVKYEENKLRNSEDYIHSGGCIAYLVEVSKNKNDFKSKAEFVVTDASHHQFSFRTSILDIEPNSQYLADCLTLSSNNIDMNNIDNRFLVFYRRYLFLLNSYEAVLFEWQGKDVKSRLEQPQSEISEQLHKQICAGPTRLLFTDGKKNDYLKEIEDKAFPKIETFIKDECP